jgi:hypothetical protein
MFIMIAIEGHGSEEHQPAQPATSRKETRCSKAPTNQCPRRPDRPPFDYPASSGYKEVTKWSTSEPDWQPWASSAPASASASLPACPATPSGATPTPPGQIRGLAIILAGFAEGLGVLAIVVGLLPSSSSRPRSRSESSEPPGGRSDGAVTAADASGLSINFFWVIVAALNFIIVPGPHLGLRLRPDREHPGQRRPVVQGLADADQARKDRESA